ncbi:hypothetical protein CEXT_651561 [Caerostris extrusa]|uniref:Uncharacterized protein n=1 Tax=Caerostris extrusa TaxID=172846 RepID=A0AAV4XXR5_CAEEX|nr:hypothetical protein CEXT_651561 [Caerostris extrusa]
MMPAPSLTTQKTETGDSYEGDSPTIFSSGSENGYIITDSKLAKDALLGTILAVIFLSEELCNVQTQKGSFVSDPHPLPSYIREELTDFPPYRFMVLIHSIAGGTLGDSLTKLFSSFAQLTMLL